jgi:hypothetical protein
MWSFLPCWALGMAQEVGFMIGFVQLPTGYKIMAKFYIIFSTLLATSADDIVWLPWGKIPNNYYTLLFRKELILLKRLVLSKDMLCISSLAPNTIQPNTTKHKSCGIKYALKAFALLKKRKCITHQASREDPTFGSQKETQNCNIIYANTHKLWNFFKNKT